MCGHEVLNVSRDTSLEGPFSGLQIAARVQLVCSARFRFAPAAGLRSQ